MRRAKSTFALPSIVALGLSATAVMADANQPKITPFAEATMIIEFNSTDEDIGIQFFLDAEGWDLVRILDPNGKEIFRSGANSRLERQGGGTELFLESVEPTLDELSIQRFFHRFPRGRYSFIGRTPEGERLLSTALFTHRIPAGPEILMPLAPEEEDECAESVPLPVDIAWNAVTTSITGNPLDIVGYQVIVEQGDREFNITLPPDVTTVTVPQGFLQQGEEAAFEILAIEAGGNQTISESCFVTAD
jgi:hypothetical protein